MTAPLCDLGQQLNFLDLSDVTGGTGPALPISDSSWEDEGVTHAKRHSAAQGGAV